MTGIVWRGKKRSPNDTSQWPSGHRGRNVYYRSTSVEVATAGGRADDGGITRVFSCTHARRIIIVQYECRVGIGIITRHAGRTGNLNYDRFREKYRRIPRCSVWGANKRTINPLRPTHTYIPKRWTGPIKYGRNFTKRDNALYDRLLLLLYTETTTTTTTTRCLHVCVCVYRVRRRDEIWVCV